MPVSPSRRRLAAPAAVAALAVGTSLASLPATAAAAPEDELASRFTFAVLPDTQFYSRYSADQFLPRYGSDPYRTQTAWLAENADDLHIPFVAHLGDVVDRVTVPGEWEAADVAMENLENADVPYSILAGNHDVRNSDDSLDDTDYDLTQEPYMQWFGTERAASQSSYGGSDATGFSQYHVFEAEGQQFLVLALPWRASDETIAWAQGVLDAHPTLPTIFTTHSLLNVEPDGISPRETEYGLELWDKLIRSNDQIFLTLNGHFHGSTQLTKTNDAGHPVHQILMDYQMAYEGGNGYLGLFEFDLTNGSIAVQTGSPWVVSKPQELLTSYDQAFLEEPHQQFTIDIDFEERFADFAPEFGPGTADEPSLTQRARDILLDGFEGPDPVGLEQPGSRDDFIEVDGTLAHWRFGDAEGVVAEGQTFEDIAGDADLHRVSIAESGSDTAQQGDVTVTSDANPYSADGAAVCFANADQRTDRFSYLATDAAAAVNDANLENGYTIETFLRVDASWTAPANQWSKAIVRSGNRSQLPGMPWSRWDYTASPAALGISNLREFQWTEVPVETTKGDRTSWSGEIILDRWVHVALVNDPATSKTTMYVDGAPVLRNALDTLGHSLNEDMPWILGADFVDDAARNGWNGCIGETRVIDHPTSPEQWLTARPALDGLTAHFPESPLPAGTEFETLSGTGTPGATVTLSGDLAGTAVVGEDGIWTLEVGPSAAAATLEPGAYELSVVQGFGDRVSEPVAGTITVAPAVVDPTEPPAGGPGDGGAPDAPSDVDGDGDDLASTGADLQPWILGFAALLILGGGALLMMRLRGRRG